MNDFPEHIRDRLFEDYFFSIQKRCVALVTGLDHCGLLETCQSCQKLRRLWLELRRQMRGFEGPPNMKTLVCWMIDIDKKAKLFASWLEKKHVKYSIHLEHASNGNTALATSPPFVGDILSLYVMNFALGNRTRRDMDTLTSKLPQHTKVRLFTATQHGACVIFVRCLKRLPRLLQSLDYETFPSKSKLIMFSCTEAQAAVAQAACL